MYVQAFQCFMSPFIFEEVIASRGSIIERNMKSYEMKSLSHSLPMQPRHRPSPQTTLNWFFGSFQIFFMHNDHEYTVGPHYSRILYLQILLLSQIYV